MMVRDEAGSIGQTIESCASSVDCVVLIDTGSTDGTVYEAMRACRECELTLHVYEEPFVDFATTRNRCMELAAAHAEWLLMLNGDETVQDAERIRSYMECINIGDAVNVEVDFGDITFRHPRITRAGAACRYEGRTHEALIGAQVFGTVPVAKIVRGTEDMEKKRKQWERDEILLGEDLIEDPDAPRAQFYLAQTLRLLGREGAAARFYRARANNERGWIAERYESLLQLAEIETIDADDHLTRAIELCPEWPDAYTLIAEHYFKQGRWQSCYLYAKRACELHWTGTTLFSRKRLDLLRWDLLSASAFYAKDGRLGRQATLMALNKDGSDEKRLRNTFRFYYPGSLPVQGSAVVVVGTGRSGTSVVTNILETLGVDMGPSIPADKNAPDGYGEDRHVRMYGLSFDWEGLWAYLVARIENVHGPVGCKSPYIAEDAENFSKHVPNLQKLIVINCERDLSSTLASFETAWGKHPARTMEWLKRRRDGGRKLASIYNGLTVPLDQLRQRPAYWVQIIADHVFGGISLENEEMHDRIAEATRLVRPTA